MPRRDTYARILQVPDVLDRRAKEGDLTHLQQHASKRCGHRTSCVMRCFAKGAPTRVVVSSISRSCMQLHRAVPRHTCNTPGSALPRATNPDPRKPKENATPPPDPGQNTLSLSLSVRRSAVPRPARICSGRASTATLSLCPSPASLDAACARQGILGRTQFDSS